MNCQSDHFKGHIDYSSLTLSFSTVSLPTQPYQHIKLFKLSLFAPFVPVCAQMKGTESIFSVHVSVPATSSNMIYEIDMITLLFHKENILGSPLCAYEAPDYRMGTLAQVSALEYILK